MKPIVYGIVGSLALALVVTACGPHSQYNTQRGAAAGAAMGALYGQAIGGDTTSTLIGTALGGLTGAVLGNYEDQRYMNSRQSSSPVYPTYKAPPPPPPPASSHYQSSGYQPQAAPVNRGGGGNWVTVPGQWLGGQFVPPHNVWVQNQRGAVPVQR